MEEWESASRVQKNDAGEFRALVNGEWVPVIRAQKDSNGNFRVMRDQPIVKTVAQPKAEQKEHGVSPLDVWNYASGARGIYGVSEGLTNLLTGTGASAAAGLQGLYTLASEGDVDKAAQAIRETSEKYTYFPKTQEGELVAKTLALPIELASKAGKEFGKRSEIAQILGITDEAESIGEIAPQVLGTVLGGRAALSKAKQVGAEAAAEKQSSLVKQSQRDAARIEAANLAKQYNIAINPAEANPTLQNKLLAKVAGERNLASQLNKVNEYRPIEIIKQELGIDPAKTLTKESIDKVFSDASVAKEAIKQINEFVDDGSAVSSIQSLKSDTMIGGKGVAKKLNTLISDAENFVSTNPSGAQIMAQIDNLREVARNIRKKDAPKKKELAEARTSIGIANALESMIEKNLGNNSFLLNQYREGRRLSAKAYVAKDIVDFNTGKADVKKLAQMTSGDTALTGAMSDLGKIYGNFPESMQAPKGALGFGDATDMAQTHLYRAGVPGTLGAIVGLQFGSPIIGAAAGAALGEVVGSKVAKGLVSPSGQRVLATPKDYRPMREQLGYGEVPKSVPLMLAPVGEPLLPPSAGAPAPQSRGLISLADEEPAARRVQVEGIDYPVAPRLNPMYQRGGVSSPESGLSLEPKLQMPTVNMTRDVPAPQGRGLLSLEEPNAPIIHQQGQPAWQKELGVDFPLRQEVLQNPEIVTAVRSFIAESERLKTLIKESGGFWKDRYKTQLAQLEQEFAAGMRQLGIDNPKQALGLQKLYQSEEGNALQIEKTRGLLD